jgi:hypothetical protein
LLRIRCFSSGGLCMYGAPTINMPSARRLGRSCVSKRFQSPIEKARERRYPDAGPRATTSSPDARRGSGALTTPRRSGRKSWARSSWPKRPRTKANGRQVTFMLVGAGPSGVDAVPFKTAAIFRVIVTRSTPLPSVRSLRGLWPAAYVERWIRSVKAECLSKIILFGSTVRPAISTPRLFDGDREPPARGLDLFVQQGTAQAFDQIEHAAFHLVRPVDREMICRCSAHEVSGIPAAVACAATRPEVGMPSKRRPCRCRGAGASVANAAVNPVPRPTTEPRSTNSTAARLNASRSASSAGARHTHCGSLGAAAFDTVSFRAGSCPPATMLAGASAMCVSASICSRVRPLVSGTSRTTNPSASMLRIA